MSGRNPEIEYDAPSPALRFAFEQWAKGINTCLPAVVQSYDAAARRAQVQIALDTLATDGRALQGQVIADVPVIFPSGGGFTFSLPLAPGNAVLLVFSQRGISQFKREHRHSLPDGDSLFFLSDAVAIAGFGPPPTEPITPVSESGVALQDYDGSNYIAIEADGIRIKTAGRLTLTDSTGTREI